MACEVRMYCDTCGSNMLLDDHGVGSFRTAVSVAVKNAMRKGFRRTGKGWQCPGCLVGHPNVFDYNHDDMDLRAKAVAAYKEKYGVNLMID